MAANGNSALPANFPPELPFDIYEHIVDQVAADDKLRPFLKDLSLTTHFLLPLCRRHLFEAVFYRRPNTEKLTVLSAAHISSYIRRVWYKFSGNDPIVIRFFEQLSCIHTLIFSSGAAMEFTALDPQLALKILAIIHSPELRWLSLNTTHDYPIGSLLQLGKSSNLACLEIRDLRTDAIIDDEQIEMQGPDAPSAPLADIYVSYQTSQVLSVLLGGPEGKQPVFNFHKVRALHVEGHTRGDIDANKRLIQACTGLQELICELCKGANTTFEGFAKFIVSGPARTLRSLHFLRPVPSLGQPDRFCGISQEVKQLSDSFKLTSLEWLDILLGIYNGEPNRTELRILCEEIRAWATEFDDIFDQHPGFPALSKVSISAFISCVPHRRHTSDEKVRARVNNILKAAATKISEECFKNLGDLPNFDFEIEVQWDLDDSKA